MDARAPEPGARVGSDCTADCHRAVAPASTVDNQQVCAIEDLDASRNQRGEGRHARNPVEARGVKASAAISWGIVWQTEQAGDIHQAVLHTPVGLQECMVVGSGGSNYENEANRMVGCRAAVRLSRVATAGLWAQGQGQ